MLLTAFMPDEVFVEDEGYAAGQTLEGSLVGWLVIPSVMATQC